MASKSNKRLTQRIKERAAQIILRELKDPRMGFVTVTRVVLSDDNSLCTIFYSVMGKPGEISKTKHGLESARGFIQKRIAEGLHTRVAPHVELEYDESLQEAMRVGELLRKLSAEREAEKQLENPDSSSEPQVDPGEDGRADDSPSD